MRSQSYIEDQRAPRLTGHLKYMLEVFVQPCGMHREMTAYDIGYEAAKQDLREQLRDQFGQDCIAVKV